MSSPAYQGFLDDYPRVAVPLAGDWFLQRRQAAIDAFRARGFPTLRDEDWKYTDVRSIASRRYEPSAAGDNGAVDELFDNRSFADAGCLELVFVNGIFSAARSRLERLPKGLVVTPLSAAGGAADTLLRMHLGQHAAADKHAFIALNLAFMGDGTLISVPDDVALEQPISIVHIFDGAATGAAAHTRNLVVLGRNARANMIESYNSNPGAQHLASAVTEIQLGPGACLEHYRLQQESLQSTHVGNTSVRLLQDSRLVSHSFTLGGALTRNEIDVRLAARGAEVILNGLYVAGGRQHVDNHTRIDHEQPDTRSEEHYRGVLDGRARAVFNGKVVVHKDAQKTDASQHNANLLLSDSAEIDTKPELEIFADDVKCSHGATVGQLDQDMLFYLRSRAIPAATARVLLTFAFAEAVISRIGFRPVRTRLEQGVVDRLPDADVIREFLR